MQSARFEQFFAAPQETVFAWFAQHRNVARLFGGRLVDTCPAPAADSAPDSDAALGVGSVRVVRLGMIRLEEAITGFEPAQCIEYRVVRGWPIREHLGRMRFAAVDGGTQLVHTVEFEVAVPGLGGLIAGLMCASWRRNIHHAVDAISGATPDA